MGGATSASSALNQERPCPPLVPTPALSFAPYEPMVRYDRCTETAYLHTPTLSKRMATDQELTMMEWWTEGGLDDVEVFDMPFCGWPYWRRLIWGCCYSDADVLARVAQPQLVADADLLDYAPPPNQMMVWVNFPAFGMARVVGFTSLRAATQQMLYFVVQKLQPFGSLQGDPYGAGFFYRVPAVWCQRMPAAVVQVRMDFGDVLVWKITNTSSEDKISTIDLTALRNPRGRVDEAELLMARSFLIKDWPRFALTLLPRVATDERYMPTDQDLRRWYGFERRRPMQRRAPSDSNNVTTTTSSSSSTSGGGQQQQQQSTSASNVNVIRVGMPLNMDVDSPLCAFVGNEQRTI